MIIKFENGVLASEGTELPHQRYLQKFFNRQLLDNYLNVACRPPHTTSLQEGDSYLVDEDFNILFDQMGEYYGVYDAKAIQSTN